MLQFFKKAGQRNKLKSSNPSCSESPSKNDQNEDGAVTANTLPHLLSSFEEEEEKDIFALKKSQIDCFHSRLSKTLPEILADKSALGYFIQFMDEQRQVVLIKFWLEVECLYSAYSVEESVSNKKDVIKSIRKMIDSTKNLDVDNCACSISSEVSDLELDSLSVDGSVSSNDQSLPVQNSNEVKMNWPQNNSAFNNKSIQCCNLEVCTKGSSQYEDAILIYRKYVKKDLGCIRIPEELKQIIEKAVTIQNADMLLQSLLDLQKIVYNVLLKEYANEFLKSDFYCKHQIDVLTSGNVQLVDILYNENAFFYFMEFMDIENKRELLDFWMTVVSYKQNLIEKEGYSDPAETQSDALIIYNKYFSLQASTPIGFSDKIRFEVEQNICREDGKPPQSDCFDRPCQLVYNFLNRHYLPAFLQSQLFYKYLTELISSVQSSHCAKSQRSFERAASDCSSEVSTISVLTSPTQSSSDERKAAKLSSSMSGGMNIDTKQLYDPDLLWKRNKSSLSVGYVDNLGRFITEIEPDPYRKNDKQSRLSRAVKKLIHIEQDEVKEESAWKIAEMIVRDVTSLTLGGTDLPS